MDLLQDLTIAFLVAPEGVEQDELTEPWGAVLRAGGIPRLISTQQGGVQAFRQLDRGGLYLADETVRQGAVDGYDGLVLPGGVAGPDYLRTRPEAVAFAKSFFDSGKPVAAIGHAPWLLIEAGVVQDRTLTSWPSLRTDLANAGARWVDVPVQICTRGPNTLVTSRRPDDLPAFCAAVVAEFAQAGRRRAELAGPSPVA